MTKTDEQKMLLKRQRAIAAAYRKQKGITLKRVRELERQEMEETKDWRPELRQW